MAHPKLARAQMRYPPAKLHGVFLDSMLHCICKVPLRRCRRPTIEEAAALLRDVAHRRGVYRRVMGRRAT